MTRHPLNPAQPHLPAILPDNPTVRVARRGHPNDVVLAYYQSPPVDAASCLHILDQSFDAPENRVPYQRSLAWPDENGILHFGPEPDPNSPFAKVLSSEAPTRFFNLTDRFKDGYDIEKALFYKAEISRSIASGNEFHADSIEIVNEDGEALELLYELEAESDENGTYRVTIYAADRTADGQTVWARYRTLDSNNIPIWVKEPLAFTSVFTDQALGLGDSTYELIEGPHSGYEARINTIASAPANNGTAFLWRVKGTLAGRTVHTPWFSAWVTSEDSPKPLDDLTLTEILKRSHPGAGSPEIEFVKLWGGSLSITQVGGIPHASTDRSGFSDTIPGGHDLIRFPYRSQIALSAYHEQTQANLRWEVLVQGERIDINPSAPHSGRGDGIWIVRDNKGNTRPSINDWNHDTGWMQLFYEGAPPDYFYAEAEIWVYAPHAVTLYPQFHNDDDVYVYVNGKEVFRHGSAAYWQWFSVKWADVNGRIPLDQGWNHIKIRIRDRGDNILVDDKTELNMRPALHVMLDNAFGSQYWMGTGPKPNMVSWSEKQSGTVALSYGGNPVTITPATYGWPNFNVRYVDVSVSGFSLADVQKAANFSQSGQFSIRITGPLRSTRGSTKAIDAEIVPETEIVRLMSFGDILADLNLTDVSPGEEDSVYVEAVSDLQEVNAVFFWASDLTDPRTYRHFTGADGAAKISVADLRAHSESNPGWLICWSKIPRDRIAKRHAFWTEDSSRIFVLPVDHHRIEPGVWPQWHLRIRPGRFLVEQPAPINVSTDRYNHPALRSENIIWTYEIPEYDRLVFDAAAPYRRVTAKLRSFHGDNRLLLPHTRLAPDPDVSIEGVTQSRIDWISPESGEVRLRSRPKMDDALRVSYRAYDDALTYMGYTHADGRFFSFSLNPSKYHFFSTNEQGEIPGHFKENLGVTAHQPGIMLPGRSFTVYILPAKAERVVSERITSTRSIEYDEPGDITGSSTGVIVSGGSLRVDQSASGVAYLAPIGLEPGIRQARISESEEHLEDGDAIQYEIFDGHAWTPMKKGEFSTIQGGLSQLSIRVVIQSASGQARVDRTVIELAGLKFERQLVASWDQSIFHTDMSPSELAADPLAIPLATVVVGLHISVDDILIMDGRRRGGGVSEEIEIPSRDDVAGYWDLGFWGGRAHQQNGIVVVELPASLLKEYGGPFEHKDVLTQLHRHLAYGHLVVVRYKGDDGSWIRM